MSRHNVKSQPLHMFEKRRIKKGAVMKATQSFAQDRGTGATPAAGAQAGATQGTFTTSDAIPWKPVDPKKPDGVQMFVVWGNPNRGASMILLKFPAGTDVGWHWHTAAYQFRPSRWSSYARTSGNFAPSTTSR